MDKKSKEHEVFIVNDDNENNHIQFSDQAASADECVTAEYMSSPIVDILALTVKDPHPKPPPNFKIGIHRMKKSAAIQCDRRITQLNDKNRNKFVESSSIHKEKSRVEIENDNERCITLLEQIVRTHPIWYLQHIGRSAATHLLRPMNEGAFIVRSSSKPNAMALSIRLAPGLSSDVDHYLVELTGPNKNVRLESSPYSFKSLPLLIQHYCLNGDELQTKLVLPAAVANCRKSMQLQSLALMGQDFWTSELAQQHSVRLSKTDSDPETLDFCYTLKKCANFSKHFVSSGTLRTSTTCGDGSSIMERFNENYGSTSCALLDSENRRGMKARTRFARTTALQKKDAVMDCGASTSAPSGSRSLLRHFFRSESSSDAISRQTKCNNKEHAASLLAQCHAFTPLKQHKITSSQSAFALSSTSSLSSQCDCPDPMPQPCAGAGISLSKQNWIRDQPPHPKPALRTFKPCRSPNGNSTTEEGIRELNTTNLHFSVNSKPAVKPKPSALRREQSDLTGACVMRIAKPYTGESSSAEGGGHGRQALIPPSACLDGCMLRKCLEELKRKRQEAAAVVSETESRSRHQKKLQRVNAENSDGGNLNNVTIILRPRSGESFRTDQRRLSAPNLADLALHPRSTGVSSGVATTAKALTSKLGRNPRTGELQTINEGLITPVVRRKQYLQDVQTSETISDRHLGSLVLKSASSHNGKLSEQQHLRHNSPGAKEQHVFTRKFHSERHSRERVLFPRNIYSGTDASQSSAATQTYAWHHPSNVKRGSPSVRNVNTPSCSNGTTDQRFNSTRNIFNSKQKAAWSAVNSELKTRQKIAKVRPTPQVPSLKRSFTTVKTASISSSNKQLSTEMTTDNDNLASDAFHSQPASSKNGAIFSQEQEQGGVETPICNSNIDENGTSEYAHLSECIDTSSSAKLDLDATTESLNQNHSGKDDDDVSVAGTIFNEPWDSNVWENLLDLAHYGDEKPSTLTRQCNTNQIVLGEAIAEEGDDDDVICSLEMSYDGEGGRCFQKLHSTNTFGDSRSSDSYGIVIRRFDNHRLNDNVKLDGRRNGMVNINTRLKSDDNMSKQQHRLEAISKSSSCGSGDVVVSNSVLNMSSTGEIFDGTVTMDSHTTNTHSLPRLFPRCSKLDDSWLASIDDIPTSIRALSPIISPPRLRNSLSADPGTKIQEYVERLAQEENTVFGATLRRFIECTFEAEECDPQVVIRNVRQFLNGLKNYLVKHGEGELHDIIENERTRLNANEFLNIDAILEAVLHKIVLCPVKPHLYHLMVREYSRNGWLQALSENLTYVRTLSPEQMGFGVHCKFIAPTAQQMETIKIYLRKMQHHYSPLKKLENLLRVIFLAIGRQQPYDSPNGDLENYDPVNIESNKVKVLPPADELVRWLVYLLARTSTVGCEVEAWYMWELLPKQLLTTGDSSYYLIALFSAIDVLKNTESIRKLGQVDDSSVTEDGSCCSSVGSISPVLSSSSNAFVKVAVPDELDGSIRYHTFPGVPQMTAGKLCRVIAHQFGITNPEDHGLYLLVDGYETCLLASECPDLIRHQLREARKAHLFAYKRHEAKIAWPKFAMSSAT